MRFLYYLVVFLLGQLLLSGGLLAQEVQLDFRQFTTDDGLPSSEVYTVMEDKQGYIWVGTDNGVARFDGYTFEVFDSDDGLGDVVVFYLLMDDNGTIWAGTYSGRVYYFNQGRFEAFAHNDKVETLREKGEYVHLVDIRPSGELIFRFQRTGIFGINQEGAINKISGDDPTCFYVYARTQSNGEIQIPPIGRGYFKHQMTGSDSIISMKILIGDENKWKEIGEVPLKPSRIVNSRGFRSFLALSESRTIYCDNTKYTLLSDGEENSFFYPEKIAVNQLIPISDTSAWALMDVGAGLQQVFFEQEFTKFRGRPVFSDVSLARGLFDKDGGFWLASLDEGLFYAPYPSQNKFTGSGEAKFLSIKLLNEDTFYAGLSNGQVVFYYRTHDSSFTVEQSDAKSTTPARSFFYNETSGDMYTTGFIFNHHLVVDGKWSYNQHRRFDNSGWYRLQHINEVNNSSFTNPDLRMISNSNWFGLLDVVTDELEVLNNSIEKSVYGLESFYVDQEGRFLLGTVEGLKEFIPDDNGGHIIKSNLGVKELEERVVEILELNDGSVLFGTRGTGIVHLGVDTTIIRKSNGLASDMVRDLHQSDDGTIWVSTFNGLSKVELLKDTFTVRTFRTENGLIDNEVQMVDTYGDAVYLATSSGIQRLVETPLNTNSYQPSIRLITVDGDTLPIQGALNLAPGYHSIKIHYSTINHRIGSNINYRYRLDDEEGWSYTQQRTVSFPRLGAGSFNFSVQSQNEDGFWSEDTQLTIDIPKLWYNTVYAWGGLTFLIGTIIFGVFYFREQRRKENQNLITQISKLEHEALHARMNPHFVFNCLNSIQNFVLDNDTRSAATYLSRFSSLIRQILRSSVDGKHTLQEEIQMLEKYLELEKLRFKTAFTHTVTVDASLDLDGISLAPLLVQPFVENAILHGMKGRKQGGRIKVAFSGDTTLLKVTVTDNGKGINRDLPKKKDSMGMDITRQRLTMMDQEGDNKSGMIIVPLFSEDGKAIGTRVELTIIPEVNEHLAIEN